jgi:hypothetical protein
MQCNTSLDAAERLIPEAGNLTCKARIREFFDRPL